MTQELYSSSQPAEQQPSHTTKRLSNERIVAHASLGAAALLLIVFTFFGLKAPAAADTAAAAPSSTGLSTTAPSLEAIDTSPSETSTYTFKSKKDIPSADDIVASVKAKYPEAVKDMEDARNGKIDLSEKYRPDKSILDLWPDAAGPYPRSLTLVNQWRARYTSPEDTSRPLFEVSYHDVSKENFLRYLQRVEGSVDKDYGDITCAHVQTLRGPRMQCAYYKDGSTYYVSDYEEPQDMDRTAKYAQLLRDAHMQMKP